MGSMDDLKLPSFQTKININSWIGKKASLKIKDVTPQVFFNSQLSSCLWRMTRQKQGMLCPHLTYLWFPEICHDLLLAS